jgi:hypothetical protein
MNIAAETEGETQVDSCVDASMPNDEERVPRTYSRHEGVKSMGNAASLVCSDKGFPEIK